MTDAPPRNFIDLTANIVSAYLSNNPTPAAEIPGLISQIHAALVRVSSGRTEAPLEPAKPAVSIKKSISPDYIVCLEDGKRFKSLKRHLRTQYNMTPEQYRDKWGLPPDYPMVAPNYAVARSQLAKEMGLGQQRRRRKYECLGSLMRRILCILIAAIACGTAAAHGQAPRAGTTTITFQSSTYNDFRQVLARQAAGAVTVKAQLGFPELVRDRYP